MKETKDMAQNIQDHFNQYHQQPYRGASLEPVLPLANSPQLSTPSPRSPTSSPASGSSGMLGHTPSPHHHHQNHHMTSITRTLHSQIYKHSVNTYNLFTAHELWEAGDNMVERYHIQGNLI